MTAPENPTSNVEQAIGEVLDKTLRAFGISDRPDLYDSDLHSWRCSYPDIYGPCDCLADLVNDLREQVAAVVAGVRAEAWDEGYMKGLDHDRGCNHPTGNPYRERADRETP